MLNWVSGVLDGLMVLSTSRYVCWAIRSVPVDLCDWCLYLHPIWWTWLFIKIHTVLRLISASAWSREECDNVLQLIGMFKPHACMETMVSSLGGRTVIEGFAILLLATGASRHRKITTCPPNLRLSISVCFHDLCRMQIGLYWEMGWFVGVCTFASSLLTMLVYL